MRTQIRDEKIQISDGYRLGVTGIQISGEDKDQGCKEHRLVMTKDTDQGWWRTQISDKDTDQG